MLEVQRYLRSGKTLEDLEKEFAIKITYHPIDPLIICNYSQINSPKTHPIVIECRGLVLEIDTWKVVARAFDRFFNMGEALEITKNFIWEGSTALSKEDGSLILLYQYNGTWRVNTRGSFAEYNINECGKSWAELFWEALNRSPDTLPGISSICYVFEFCSVYNKTVRLYTTPQAILLALTDIENCQEFTNSQCNFIADVHGFKRPESYKFENADSILKFLNDKEEIDPTFEGVVVRDITGMRMKVKSKTYVALHQMRGNDNIFLAKNLVPFILAGEIDEVLCYFKEAEPILREIELEIKKLIESMEDLWKKNKNNESQKEFALSIKNHPLNGILFNARKLKCEPKLLLRENQNLFIKIINNTKKR